MIFIVMDHIVQYLFSSIEYHFNVITFQNKSSNDTNRGQNFKLQSEKKKTNDKNLRINSN